MSLPRFLTWRERFAHEQTMALPKCPECGMRRGHKIECSQWEPIHDLPHYAELEQRRHYRDSVRDLGCTCHWRMPPHVHGLTCPMYRTEDEWSEHLQIEHEDDR
jgi:hypothetical protein